MLELLAQPRLNISKFFSTFMITSLKMHPADSVSVMESVVVPQGNVDVP